MFSGGSLEKNTFQSWYISYFAATKDYSSPELLQFLSPFITPHSLSQSSTLSSPPTSYSASVPQIRIPLFSLLSCRSEALMEEFEKSSHKCMSCWNVHAKRVKKFPERVVFLRNLVWWKQPNSHWKISLCHYITIKAVTDIHGSRMSSMGTYIWHYNPAKFFLFLGDDHSHPRSHFFFFSSPPFPLPPVSLPTHLNQTHIHKSQQKWKTNKVNS